MQTSGGTAQSQGGAQANTSQNITFRSEDIGTKTARKQDVFAEHKRKDAEKKAKQKITMRKALIFGGLALVVVVLIIILVVVIMKLGGNGTSDDGNVISEAESERRQQITQDVYDKANADGANAEEVFQEALDSAKTPADVDAVRMGQLQYFTSNGNYEKVIETGDQIGGDPSGGGSENTDACESTGMDVWAKMRCHNMMALAYESMDKYDLSDYHWERTYELADEAERLTGGEN